MKVIILAGGLPSSISEERIPKPMLKVGERPLLWHIMKSFSMYGYTEFIVCTGYRSEMIKDYFLNYYIYRSDITVDLKSNEVEVHNNRTDDWNVTIVDTGLEASTAKRIKKIEKYIQGEEFLITYGDCISNIDVRELVEKHKKSGKILTMAVAKPSGRSQIVPLTRNGTMKKIDDCSDMEFEAWANACTMVASSKVLEYIDEDTYDRFEIETIRKLAAESNVVTYKHNGFWIPIETVRDRLMLEQKWQERSIPWRE